MLRFLYDWLVLAPANLVAGLLVGVLMLIPVTTGCGVGALVYALTERRRLPHDGRPKKQYFAIAVAAIAGLYLALLTAVAFTRLPVFIFRILNGV